jgi:hypothetical protein
VVRELVEKSFFEPWRQSCFFGVGLPVAGDPGGAKIRKQQGNNDDLDDPDDGLINKKK